MKITEWLARYCATCDRVRVHYRTSGAVRCIGTIPNRVNSKPCERAA